MKYALLIAATAVGLTAGTAYADSGRCSVSSDQWRPREALQAQLEAEGLDVRQIEVDDGCFEVKAISANGTRVENLYNPATFALIISETGMDDAESDDRQADDSMDDRDGGDDSASDRDD
jgi:hypothetical protein